MKRSICVFLSVVICMIAVFSMTAYAKNYSLAETDMQLTLDDTVWYVFTRDNIRNNPELEELGISYEEMNKILQDNEAYLDAIVYYEDGEFVELFVRKRMLDVGIANLSNYDNEQVLELAKEMAKKQGAETYSVYESPYKFAKLEYVDKNLGYYICEFATIVNCENYTVTFQSTSAFSDLEYEEIERIMKSIQFDVDTSLQEGQSSSIFDGVVGWTIGGAAIGGAVGAVIAIVNNKKKQRSESSAASATNNTGM